MNFLSNVKNITRKAVFASVIAVVAISALATIGLVQAQASGSDCDNAVVCGGVSGVGQVQHDYHNGASTNSKDTAKSIKDIYSYFGISASDINTMSAVTGEVYSDGRVTTANGKVVATNALTAGRLNATNTCGGSNQKNVNGTKFWVRKPCVSFKSSPLSALVVMKNGVFQFAIIKSCGNPVTGTPKQPAPTPTPATHYACSIVNNAPVCTKKDGKGQSLATCNSTCKAPKPTATPTPTPATHYACSIVNNAPVCTIHAGVGQSLATCKYTCKAPTPTATCTPTPEISSGY